MVKPSKFKGGANNKSDTSFQVREDVLRKRREARERQENLVDENQILEEANRLANPSNPAAADLHAVGYATEIKKLTKELKDEKKKVIRLEETFLERNSLHEKSIAQVTTFRASLAEEKEKCLTTMQKYDEAKATNTDLKEVIDRAVDVLRKATRDGEVIKGAVNGRQVDVQRVLSSESVSVTKRSSNASDQMRMAARIEKLERDLAEARYAISGLSLLPAILDRTTSSLSIAHAKAEMLESESTDLLSLLNAAAADKHARASIFAIHTPPDSPPAPKWTSWGREDSSF